MPVLQQATTFNLLSVELHSFHDQLPYMGRILCNGWVPLSVQHTRTRLQFIPGSRSLKGKELLNPLFVKKNLDIIAWGGGQ